MYPKGYRNSRARTSIIGLGRDLSWLLLAFGQCRHRSFTLGLLGRDAANRGRGIVADVVGVGRQRMALEPKHTGRGGRIDAGGLPPGGFIAAGMDLTVVGAAQRDGELIADFAAERATLCKADVVGICGSPTADQARMLSDKFESSALRW